MFEEFNNSFWTFPKLDLDYDSFIPFPRAIVASVLSKKLDIKLALNKWWPVIDFQIKLLRYTS